MTLLERSSSASRFSTDESEAYRVGSVIKTRSRRFSEKSTSACMALYVSGLLPRCELVYTTFESSALRAKNPLGKLPVLVDGDLVLFESTWICEYLDDLARKENLPRLYFRDEKDYFERQSMHALANGLLDSSVSLVMELRRTTEHNPYWMDRFETAIRAALRAVRTDVLGNPRRPDIVTIAWIAALGYLDFRLSQFDFRSENPSISRWYSGFMDLDWVQATAPRDAVAESPAATRRT